MNEIKVGNYIKKDGVELGERVFGCDDWDRADFRWPNPIGEWRESHAVACKIKVTGRVAQWFGGESWMRVRIEWVQDDEASTFSGGYVMIESDESRERNGRAFGVIKSN